MSYGGKFETEDEDIVKLSPESGGVARSGYVNVGTHAIWIQLDDAGNLTVEVNARTNEAEALGTVSVTKESSVAQGGRDPDEE